MISVNRLTRYFRQSLIDADRLCPEDKDVLPLFSKSSRQTKDSEYLRLDREVWEQGYLDETLARNLCKAKQPSNKRRQGREPDPISIVLFPRVDLIHACGSVHDNRKRQVLLPLVVFARLHPDGQLLPDDKIPWIPRVWINPSQSAAEPFTEMALVDEFYTQNRFEGIAGWEALKCWCTGLLSHATGYSSQEATGKDPALRIAELDLSPEYKPTPYCLLQIEQPVVGAKRKMLSVLDTLIDTDEQSLPPLYKRYCCQSSPRMEPHSNLSDDVRQAKKHLGQMTGEFPLAEKQRNALHYLFTQKHGEILAVNGPPGTGKTTLLRSVVASFWVARALEKADPPLIMATSNNNQAVTNILESFARVDEAGLEDSLKGRWLPEVDSYGLYFCASNKANNSNPYRYSGSRGEGCMKDWQDQAFIDKASDYFLAKATAWLGYNLEDISEVRDALHSAMKCTEKEIVGGIEYLAKVESLEKSIEEQYGSYEQLCHKIDEQKNLVTQQQNNYREKRQLLDEFYSLIDARSVWTRCLLWFGIKPVCRQEEKKIARLLNRYDVVSGSYSDDVVESQIQREKKDAGRVYEKTEFLVTSLQKLAQQYQQASSQLKQWLDRHDSPLLMSGVRSDRVVEINDRVLRFRLFKLVTHYWEACWLMETDAFVISGDSDKKSPAKTLRKLRRYAKLMPCFVSTFYMVPSTFMAGEYESQVWQDLPLLDEIDLLIVDEAGQAVPDVAAASFALARQALVVGDVDQIEPVWSLPVSVDRANLKLFDLLGSESLYNNFWLSSGLLSSSGNVMRVAQRQCCYQQFEQLQRGLYLTEHRRCYDSIIGYCNTLVYKGILEARRGKPGRPVPWGAMTMVPVVSESRSYGGSRGNPGEAKAIAQWVVSERKALLEYARQKNKILIQKSDEQALKSTVGIVTPFKKQAMLIRLELSRAGIKGLTVGTVHSLQGDERLIVLFSSVYGKNDRSASKFYDSGYNMLNVAVSRAKDAFVVFGDPGVFGVSENGCRSGKPSVLLKERLFVRNKEALIA